MPTVPNSGTQKRVDTMLRLWNSHSCNNLFKTVQ